MVEGWQRKSLGSLFEVQLGKMLNKAAKEKAPQYPYLTNVNVRWGAFDVSQLNTMFFSDTEKRKFELRRGDILICEGGEIGRCAVWESPVAPCYYQKALHRLRPRGPILPRYFQVYMEHISGTKILTDFSSRTSIAHLTREKLIELPVLLPPLPEQRNIAEILRTWDEAIEKLEALRGANFRRRTWLRTDLFAGKRRLPGFSGEWNETRLSDVLTEHRLQSTGVEEVFSVSVHKGLVNQIEHLGRSFAAKETGHYNRVLPGDIVYTKSPTGDFPLGIIKQSKIAQEVIVSPLYGVFTPVTRELGVILDAYFESPVTVRNYLHPLVQKGAKNTIAITNSRFLEGSLLLPLDPSEQKAIAAVVEAQQEELGWLEAEIDALTRQKRGLMQKLLTGEWRVAHTRPFPLTDNREDVCSD